jgi:DNA (cytosine-5)-methyltransferase 1
MLADNKDLAQRATRVTLLLAAQYKSPILGNKTDPLDELIFILLSEKTDETKYVKAFENLKARFPQWSQLLTARSSAIEHEIGIAGMGKRRSALLKRMLCAAVERFGSLDLSSLASMSAEKAEQELLRLPGVGRKAARCVLLYCFNFPMLPVDIHTYRIAIRLGILTRRTSYDDAHTLLPQLISPKLRRDFHVNAVAHGRARCFAHAPKCLGCPLSKICSHAKAIRPLPINVRPRPIAIDLFAGAGGMSLGFEKAGLDVVQAIEMNRRAAATYKHNRPKVDVIEGDIRSVHPRDCLRRLALRPGDVSVLIGGIPCQGFSESNRRTRTSANERNHLYREFVRFLGFIRPIWFVIENVAGLRTMERGVILKRILEECRAKGYTVDWKELNAADYGTPQLRRRIFIIGNRLGLPISFPESTHGPKGKAPVCVRRAIGDLPQLKNGASADYKPYGKSGRGLTEYQRTMRASMNGTNCVQGNLVTLSADVIIKRYRHIGVGRNWEAIPTKLMENYSDSSRCHTGIYHRLDWNKPSKVIGNFRKNMLIHPQQHRGLSVREAARLQSFPDDYEFLNSIGFQQQQVADAVPPLLAEAVARCLMREDRRIRVSFRS